MKKERIFEIDSESINDELKKESIMVLKFKLVLAFIKKKKAGEYFTANQICRTIMATTDVETISQSEVRAIIHIIRKYWLTDSIVASSLGYKTSRDPDEIYEYAERLRKRAMSQLLISSELMKQSHELFEKKLDLRRETV